MLDVDVTLIGERPLIVKSDRGVNPLDPLVRELAKVTGKRKKTEEDHELISRIEFELGLYWHEDIGPYIPTGNIHKCFIEAARQSKLGKNLEQGSFSTEVRVPILYEGPRDIEGLFQKPDHVYTVSVGIGQKRTMRTRPRFMKWAIEIPFVLDPEKVDLDVFMQVTTVAGRYIGLGERRPNKGGPFGVFTATVEAKTGALTNGRKLVHA
jgi:hypothetical protein